MFAKLLVVVVTAAVTAAALLALRQQRLELAHEASVIHRRLSAQEAALWEMQQQIAGACRPETVRSLVQGAGGRWVPVPATPRPAPPPPAHLAEGTPADPDPGSRGDAG